MPSVIVDGQNDKTFATPNEQNEELSPASPNEDSDTALLSPVAEPEPIPGLEGVPVRWYDADRKEPYTRITPFQEKRDTSVEFFYKPITLTALGFGMAALAYVATTQDVLEEGKGKRWVGAYAVIVSFLMFSMIQFRDGPFIRPHPAFWRMVLGINLLYELALVYLLFEDLDSARSMMKHIDPNLGVPLPEKSYAEDCTFSFTTIWNAIDVFCLAHALGWFGKAMILRDYWFCWILSIAFELAEYSLQHQLANFAECWWDHWILDVLLCNWLGTYLGMKFCTYFEVKPYEWRGIRQTRGLRSKAKRVLSQFSPHDFTSFKWGTATDFTHFVAVHYTGMGFSHSQNSPITIPGATVDGAGPSYCHYTTGSCVLMGTPCRQRALPVHQRPKKNRANGSTRLAVTRYDLDRVVGDI